MYVYIKLVTLQQTIAVYSRGMCGQNMANLTLLVCPKMVWTENPVVNQLAPH